METITLEQLHKLFGDLRAETSWNMDGEMLWGYYFVSDDANKLTEAGALLASEGYDVAGVFENEDEPGFILHVQKLEVHTPESLFARNAVLEQFAAANALRAYDGMDVSPAGEEGGFENEVDPDFPTDETKIANPGLIEAMDALKSSPDDEEAQIRLGIELEGAIFLVPVFNTPDASAEAGGDSSVQSDDQSNEEDGEEGEAILFMVCSNDDGEEYLPLFTDLAALKEWAEQPSAAMILSAAEAWEFVLSEEDFSGAVINPHNQSLELDLEQIELLAEPLEECECEACDEEESEDEEGGKK